MLGTDIDSSEVMAVKRYMAPIGWALGMLVLILDGKTALAGAAAGVELCTRTLIPSLFPFFVLSSMLAGSLSGGGLMLAGILGGYPVGAANAKRAWRTGRIGKAEAERMAVLSNCAGPSFIFGVIGPMFDSILVTFCLWAVYLLSVLALWFVLPGMSAGEIPGKPVRLHEALYASLRAMAGVCGWVVLFRVLLAILDRWILWILPGWGKTFVYGVLELTNGCLALGDLEQGLRFVLAAGMVSFGGLCVMVQTAAVTEGLSLRYYLPGKLFQCAVSMLLASFVQPGAISAAAQGVLALIAMSAGIFLGKSKKRCGNPSPVIV